MAFYKWNSIEDFNTWHESIKLILGLPYDDGITTEYTTALLQEDGSVIAYADEEYADKLTPCQYTPISQEYAIVDEA